MRTLLVPCLERLARGEPLRLVTVVATRGATPGGTSSSLARFVDGTFVGTIGGGALEADALRVLDAMEPAAAPAVRERTLDPSGGLDLVCGGVARLRFEVVVPGSSAASALEAAARARSDASGGWLVFESNLGEGRAPLRFVAPGRRDPDPFVFEVRERAARRTTSMTFEGRTHLIEPLRDDGRLLVFGAGHVGREVCKLAASCDFDVHLHEDRPGWLEAAAMPIGVHIVELETLEAGLVGTVAPEDRVVSVHRSHRGDELVVDAALRASASYVGMIGSRAKRHAVFERLRARGHDDATLARVRSPIGLPIHAAGPCEIAVSIVAELIAHRNRPEVPS